MKKEYCLSLNEILLKLFEDHIPLQQFLEEVCKVYSFGSIDRIYFGSNFCSQYFLNSAAKANEKLIDYARENDISLTLCVPVMSEKDLEKGKQELNKMLLSYGQYIDEVTVNDIGMLDYVCNNFPRVGVNLGRLFNKDTRDIRYEEYANYKYRPKLLTLMSPWVSRYSVKSVEFDPTHAMIDVSDIKQIPAMYYPYCYATVGNVCEIAAINMPLDKKFRPNAPCHTPCMNTYITYASPWGHQYVKLGRTVYFKHERAELVGAEKQRIIYEPFDILLKQAQMR